MRSPSAIALVGILLTLVACREDSKPNPEAPRPALEAPGPGTPLETQTTSSARSLDTEPAPSPDHRPSEAPPLHEVSKKDLEATLANLERWVKPGATYPRNAWALAHGIVAFGRDLKASDGRLAIDVIVSDYLETESRGARTVYRFPAARDQVPVEPHQDLMVKTFLEAKVPRDRVFTTRSGAKVTMAALLASTEREFAFPTDDRGWRNYAWSASALLMAHRDQSKIVTGQGDVAFSLLADRTMSRLEQEQAFLEPLLGHPEQLEKRRQGIYAHHCGGLHFVQAADLAAAITKDPAMVARAKKQLDLVLFRWDAERRLYKDLLMQPKYRWLILVQELKFYGHILETYGLAVDEGVIRPDGELSRKMRQLAGDLVETISALRPLYEGDSSLAQLPPQTLYDLVGDGCHAIRGLRRALVAFFST